MSENGLFLGGAPPEDSVYIGVEDYDLNDPREELDELRDCVQSRDEVMHVIKEVEKEISCPSPHSVSKSPLDVMNEEAASLNIDLGFDESDMTDLDSPGQADGNLQQIDGNETFRSDSQREPLDEANRDFLDHSVDLKDAMSIAQSTMIDKTLNLSESYGISSTSLCMEDVTVLSSPGNSSHRFSCELRESQESDHGYHSMNDDLLSLFRDRLLKIQEVLNMENKEYEQNISSLLSKLDLSQKEVMNLKKINSLLEKEKEKTKIECDKVSIDLNDKVTEIENLKTKIKTMEETFIENENLKKQLELNQSKFQEIFLKNENLEKKLKLNILESENLKKQLETNQSNLQELSLKNENFEEKLKETFLESENLKKLLETNQSIIQEITQKNENLEEKLKETILEMEGQLQVQKDENDILKKRLETAQNEQFSHENQNLKERLRTIQNENETLNHQLEMARNEMEKYEKCIKESKSFIAHFHGGLKKLFSIDKELHEYEIDRTKQGLDSAFKLLSQRLVSIFDAKRICRDEQNKANSLKVENEILSRQISQSQNEIDDFIKKVDFYQESVRAMTESNCLLVKTNTELLEQNEIFKKEIQKYANAKPLDEREFENLKEKVQELKLDIVDKDSKISSLELHIKSCCSYYREKAQKYKIELSDLKQQLKCVRRESGIRMSQIPFLPPTKAISPKKKNSSEMAVQTEKFNSPPRMLSMGIVEKHKLKELEDVVLNLEKENMILKRLCHKRNETIKMLKGGV